MWAARTLAARVALRVAAVRAIPFARLADRAARAVIEFAAAVALCLAELDADCAAVDRLFEPTAFGGNAAAPSLTGFDVNAESVASPPELVAGNAESPDGLEGHSLGRAMLAGGDSSPNNLLLEENGPPDVFVVLATSVAGSGMAAMTSAISLLS